MIYLHVYTGDTYDPNQQRDPGGKWTSGGGGGSKKEEPKSSKVSETFKPGASPTPTEQAIVKRGNTIKRPGRSKYPDELQYFRDDLPLYEETVSSNSVWPFMQTSKGIATVSLDDVYGVDTPTMKLHWLVAHDRGAGHAAMELMAKAADKHGITLIGDAVPLRAEAGKKMPVAELEEWYAGFGFKRKGKPDKDGYSHIVREPQKESDT